MPRERKDLEAALERKGFVRDDRHHHYFIYETMSGMRTPIRTRTSHGSAKYKTLGNPLLAKMAKDCHLTNKEFLDLVDCPLEREAYDQLVDESG